MDIVFVKKNVLYEIRFLQIPFENSLSILKLFTTTFYKSCNEKLGLGVIEI